MRIWQIDAWNLEGNAEAAKMREDGLILFFYVVEGRFFWRLPRGLNDGMNMDDSGAMYGIDIYIYITVLHLGG